MNLLRDLPNARAAEITEALAATPGLRIERIVSLGQTSPPGFWYDQDEAEWVVLLAGAARLRFAGGTGNRCAMLRQGYGEILTAVATPGGNTVLARQLRERIADHVGLHLAAFSSADAAAEHRRLAEAGFATLPLVDMRRPVTTHTGSEDARFTIARIAHHSMPEGRVQFLTHHTEPLVWRDGFLDHPNGARALTGLWIAGEKPAEPTARFGRFTGRPASHAGEVTTIALERGAIHIAQPRYLRDAFGITPAGTLPCLDRKSTRLNSSHITISYAVF